MTLRFRFLLFALCLTNLCVGQGVQHALGLGYLAYGPQAQVFTFEPLDRAPYQVETGIQYKSAIALFYSPVFSLKQLEAKNMGIALSFPLSLSAFARVAVVNGQTYKDERNYLLFSLPATIEWGIGERAFPQATNKAKIGAFVGLGGGLTLGSGAIGKFSNFNPYGTIGIRKGIGSICLQLAYGVNYVSNYKPNQPVSYSFITNNQDGKPSIRAPREREPHQTHTLNLSILLK